MNERFDRDEVTDAVALDRAVDDALAGRSVPAVEPATAAVLRRLVDAHRLQPPPTLAARVASAVRRSQRRTWLPVRVAAAALAVAFLGQGAGNLLLGRWVTGHLHAAFDPHLLFEGGIALLALGAVLAAGALTRRGLDVAVVAAAPVGVAFAVHGWPELAEFPAGGLLHLTQGVAAIALLVLWWRARRYGLARPTKRGRDG